MENEYKKLISKYALLPESKQHLGIFEVSGYPHYENVCSNVLAFYLHPQKEHGFGHLFLTALLKLAKVDVSELSQSIKIDREYPTLNGGRLDLMIFYDSYAIGVENKIFHHLNNDLFDYRATIDWEANDRKLTPLRIVLSLRRIVESEALKRLKTTGFINVTYEDLWRELRTLADFPPLSAPQKWTAYLLDFVKTTELLAGESMELTDQDRFFIEHEGDFERLICDRQSLLDRLSVQVAKLKEIIEASDDAPKNFEKRKIYYYSCLYHEFLLSGHLVVFDLDISPSGWVLRFFNRYASARPYVRKLISSRREAVAVDLKHKDRYIIDRWPLSTSLEEIKDGLFKWITWIVQQDAILSDNIDEAVT